jgi:hypothetical protein
LNHPGPVAGGSRRRAQRHAQPTLLIPWRRSICRRKVEADTILRFNTNPVIHGILDILFAPEVALCRLHRYMPEKELDLFEFAACNMT